METEAAEERPGQEFDDRRRGLNYHCRKKQRRRTSDDHLDGQAESQQRALPQVARLALSKEERRIYGGRERQRQRHPENRVGCGSEYLVTEPDNQQRAVRGNDEGSPREPRPPVGLGEDEPEPLGSLQVRYQQQAGDPDRNHPQDGRHARYQRATGIETEQSCSGSQENRSGGYGFRP